MNFKYSCIGDNTPENREWLEKIGYKVKSYESDDTLIWAQLRGIAYTEKELPNDNRTVNCVDNDPLFRAVTAIRDDSDYMQLFVWDVNIFTKDYENLILEKGSFELSEDKDFIGVYYDYPKEAHKATLDELINHFKQEGSSNY